MGFLYVLHVIIAILMIIAVLLQAGRGGGLTESASSAESLLGTQTNNVMVRITGTLAALFLGMSVLIGIFNARQEVSLMATVPEAKSTVVDVEKLFDQPASQTIEIDATLPTAEEVQ